MRVRPNEDSNQPSHPRSGQNLHCPLEKTLYSWLFKILTVKIFAGRHVLRWASCPSLGVMSFTGRHVRRWASCPSLGVMSFAGRHVRRWASCPSLGVMYVAWRHVLRWASCTFSDVAAQVYCALFWIAV